MVSHPYVGGITDNVSRRIASSLTAGQIAADRGTVSVWVACPDRWFPGDFAVVTWRDGRPFADQVQSMDVCTGEVTIRGAGQLTANAPPSPVSAARASAGGLSRHHPRSPATGTSRCTRPGHQQLHQAIKGNYHHEHADPADEH